MAADRTASIGGTGTQRLTTVTAQQALVESLRDRILSGELEDGAIPSEVELAREYGVARTTIRSAMQALVHEGLLRREPHRRAFVPRLSAEQVRDLYFARAVIEIAAVESLLRDRRSVAELLAPMVARFTALSEHDSWRAAVDADIGFHRALIDAVGSACLRRAWRSLEAETRLALVQLRPTHAGIGELAAEHCDLLDAIDSGGGTEARRAVRTHLETSAEQLMARAVSTHA